MRITFCIFLAALMGCSRGIHEISENAVYVENECCVVNATVPPEEFNKLLDECSNLHQKHYKE